MQEVMVSSLNGLVSILQPLILMGIAALNVALVKWIISKAKNSAVQMILLKIENMVFTVVRELEQTMVVKFKDASSDGKLTPEEIKALKDAALDKLGSYLSFKEIVRILGLSGTDKAQQLIESKIEGAVQQLKVEKTANLPLP